MADVLGDGFVVADHPHGQSEARPVDQPSGDEDDHRQREQHPEQVGIGEVGKDVQSHPGGEIRLHPGHQLADEFGHAQRENHEINSRKAERGETDHGGDDGAGQRRHQNQRRERQNVDAEPDRVGANPEEGRGRQRNIVRRTRKKRPSRAQCGIHRDVDGQGKVVALIQLWQVGDDRHHRDRQSQIPPLGPCQSHHADCLPKMPCGRKSSTSTNIK